MTSAAAGDDCRRRTFAGRFVVGEGQHNSAHRRQDGRRSELQTQQQRNLELDKQQSKEDHRQSRRLQSQKGPQEARESNEMRGQKVERVPIHAVGESVQELQHRADQDVGEDQFGRRRACRQARDDLGHSDVVVRLESERNNRERGRETGAARGGGDQQQSEVASGGVHGFTILLERFRSLSPL